MYGTSQVRNHHANTPHPRLTGGRDGGTGNHAALRSTATGKPARIWARGFASVLALALCAPGFASTPQTSPTSRTKPCTDQQLRGVYVFTASGFTRPPVSLPGTLWVPKAIQEVLVFNGDGTLTTPAVTVANPFGDLGTIVQPPTGGAPGAYIVNADCTGTVQFFDASGVKFAIYVEAFGNSIRMIQTYPANNVFQGTAERAR